MRNFDSYPQPEWNKADTLPRAIGCMSGASNEQSSWDAYSHVLFAVGNNHAGTYFPVVLAVIPLLAEVLKEGGQWARHCAVEVLIDLVGSFEPESGYETYEGRSVREQLRAAVMKVVPDIAALAEGEGVVRSSAVELLACLEK